MATHADTAGVHTTPAQHEAAQSALAHHFDNMEQQKAATTMGMWLFLVQEVMFFGGLFLAYAVYRALYPQAWAAGSSHLNWKLGGFNTVVLICSSLTMALAVWAAQAGRPRKTQVLFLVLTAVLGLTFLGVKAVEYADKYQDGLIPFAGWFSPTDPHTRELFTTHGATLQNVQMFYWIYFAMTGLHALHMIIGIAIIIPIIWAAWREKYSPEYYAPVELFGLYWHFVDIVWIFLFPLLYLLGAHLAGGH
ncbi:MAG TPA: cytochrome c oxidase subunit 3 family protein [Pyrinomonadaceae bacterium]|nr:cytochrome c oxidase subunit 3 family protein [Pyrinomonadaceae bacterium]